MERGRRRVSTVEWAVVIGTVVILVATAVTVVSTYRDRPLDWPTNRVPAAVQETQLTIVGRGDPMASKGPF